MGTLAAWVYIVAALAALLADRLSALGRGLGRGLGSSGLGRRLAISGSGLARAVLAALHHGSGVVLVEVLKEVVVVDVGGCCSRRSKLIPFRISPASYRWKMGCER